MSETWQTLPGLPEPGFSADPRRQPRVRASDADRQHAQHLLRTARAEGRLTEAELDERVGEADQARTLGDLNDLLDDVVVVFPAGPRSPRLPVPAVPKDLPVRAAAAGRKGLDVAIRIVMALWITLAAFFNLIWLVTGAGYWWPGWPMMGTAIPVAVLVAIRTALAPPTNPPAPPPGDDLR